MVRGDLDHPDTLAAAFSGAHAIYAITDFWQPYFNPGTKEKLKEGQILNELCFDLEVQQGKNIANAAAKVETLERYVCSSLSDVKKWSKGKYTWVYHFDGKAKVVKYIKDELPELAAKMSVLQVGLYATHWQAAPFLAPQKVKYSHKIFHWSLRLNDTLAIGWDVCALAHSRSRKAYANDRCT